MRNGGGTKLGCLLAVVLLFMGMAGIWGLRLYGSRHGAAVPSAQPVFVARQGPLTIRVGESGTIKNRDQVVIKCEVEGKTTILSLVEEGTYVDEGDLLVELDASSFASTRVGQEISLQNAEAAFVRARESLAVAKSQAESDVAQAELKHQFAQEDLVKYEQGEYPQELKEAQSKITIAEEELQRAEDRLKWSQSLHDERYLSRSELDADRLAASKAELNLELAKGKRDLLTQYTHARRLSELKSDVEQTRMALDRARRKASADVVQAQADLKAKELQHQREKLKLGRLTEQISKCKIYAPVAAMVVYATTGKGGWRGNEEPLAEGRQVREREELIFLPTASAMVAEIKIHESSLEKVRVGMPVQVSVDALAGKTYWGEVAKIALLPDATSVWLNPDLKVFTTEVHVEDPAGRLRAGMSCRAEIIVHEYDSTVYVPVQAVLRAHGQSVVHLPGAGMRVVQTGLDNNRMVAITDGLAAGEAVLMAPPLEAAEVSPEGAPPRSQGRSTSAAESAPDAGGQR